MRYNRLQGSRSEKPPPRQRVKRTIEVKYYCFHKSHVHNIDECIHLKFHLRDDKKGRLIWYIQDNDMIYDKEERRDSHRGSKRREDLPQNKRSPH